jgi:hypothetical protein
MINLKRLGGDHGLTEVLFWHKPGRPDRGGETSVRIAGVPAKIRRKHLPNANLEHYC